MRPTWIRSAALRLACQLRLVRNMRQDASMRTAATHRRMWRQTQKCCLHFVCMQVAAMALSANALKMRRRRAWRTKKNLTAFCKRVTAVFCRAIHFAAATLRTWLWITIAAVALLARRRGALDKSQPF